MENLIYLRDLVVILGVSVAVVAALNRFNIPAIAGFILAGVIVGPQALGVIKDAHEVEVLAEVGVALLLFGIGLELSLDRLRRLWWLILVGGVLQVGMTILAAFGVSRLLGFEWRTSLFIGFLVAVSSTAIVLRGLESRGEIDAPHGRLTLGILVFQDLCVVPMMLAIPILSGSGSSFTEIAYALLRALAIIAGVLVAARFIVPRVMDLIAGTRQRHLFATTVLLTCIGIAWLISSAGVSLALGAFLAGLVVAGSEYRHQALADLIPFKDVFTSIFFVSIGMLLDLGDIVAHVIPILLLLAAILIGKSFIVFITGSIMRLPLRVRVLAAAALAQVGEFSFILAYAARGTNLLPDPGAGNLYAAAILSMFVTPFALSFGPTLAAGVGRIRFFTRLQNIASAEDVTGDDERISNHIIIGGYGFAGRRLAEALKACGIPYVIVELNAETVRTASTQGESIYFGDITSPDVLERLGIHTARGFIVVINDPNAVGRAVRAARGISPHIRIMARTNFLLDIDHLLAAGADEVVSAEVESAGEIVARVLIQCDIENGRIQMHRQSIREQRREESS